MTRIGSVSLIIAAVLSVLAQAGVARAQVSTVPPEQIAQRGIQALNAAANVGVQQIQNTTSATVSAIERASAKGASDQALNAIAHRGGARVRNLAVANSRQVDRRSDATVALLKRAGGTEELISSVQTAEDDAKARLRSSAEQGAYAIRAALDAAINEPVSVE